MYRCPRRTIKADTRGIRRRQEYHAVRLNKKKLKTGYGFASLAGYLADKAATEARALCGLSRQVVGGSQLRWLVPAFCTALLCVAGSARGETDVSGDALHDIDIPAMNAAEALNRLAEQTDSILLFPYDLARSREANATVGQYTLLDALDVLLENTGLSGGLSDKQVIQISEVETDTDNDEGETMNAPKKAGLVAILASVFASGVEAQNEADEDDEQRQLPLEEIVVTGSRIRGAQSASPIVTISREEIDMAGFGTVEEIVENLPQNFGAGATSDTNNGTNIFQTVGGNVQSFAGGTSVNLRGLGASSTLILLNGRRLSPSGFSSRFTSVSSIPVSAIERVEVMTDGASAIYGSDAIGGVVNFILREEYDGAETRLRYGSDSGGDASNLSFGQSFGTSWNDGNVLFTYEYRESGALAAADRRFTASNDLSSFGGTDWRQPGGNPANIRVGSFPNYVFYAIPDGQDGTALTPADFIGLENTQRLLNGQSNIDTTPDVEQHSAFLHWRQSVGAVELFGAARFSREERETRFAQRVVDFNVQGDDPATPETEGNPWFVDPTGTGLTAVRIDNYALFDDFGPQINFGEVESSGATLGAEFRLGTNWQAELVGNWSKEEAPRWFGNRVDTAALTNAVNETDPNLAFNPFGDGSNTNPEVIESVVDRRQFRQSSENELWSTSLNVNGELFDVGGGTAKVATGIDFREESLLTVSDVTDSTFDRGREIWAAYGELFLPLVGNSNSRNGLRRLEVSLAARYEDYSDFGDSINPKVGLYWSPTESLAFKGTFGTSYRAPALTDLDDSGVNWVYVPADLFNLSDSVLVTSGRNSSLDAEEATTWTAGVRWNIGGLSLDVTYFDVDFSGRIEIPTINIVSAITEPRFASIRIENPTTEQIAAVANDPDYDPERYLSRGFGPFPAADLISGVVPVDAIVDNRLTNLADSIVTGVELKLSYAAESRLGLITADLNGSYLFDFERRLLSTDPLIDEVDTFGRPVDLRARGNVGWSRGGWSVIAFVNYTDGYTDNVSVPARDVDSWTTMDLTVAYDTQRPEGFFSDVRMALTTQNLFDEDPPFVDTSGGVGYDSNNANPMGRLFSLQITKDW